MTEAIRQIDAMVVTNNLLLHSSVGEFNRKICHNARSRSIKRHNAESGDDIHFDNNEINEILLKMVAGRPAGREAIHVLDAEYELYENFGRAALTFFAVALIFFGVGVVNGISLNVIVAKGLTWLAVIGASFVAADVARVIFDKVKSTSSKLIRFFGWLAASTLLLEVAVLVKLALD